MIAALRASELEGEEVLMKERGRKGRVEVSSSVKGDGKGSWGEKNEGRLAERSL